MHRTSNAQRPVPIPACYWVLPGHFLAGEYPGHKAAETLAERITAFLDAGVTFFLDLTHDDDDLLPYEEELQAQARRRGIEVTHVRMPIEDVTVPKPAHMRVILDTLDDALVAGRVVYLHCWGGTGRTGTTVGCYLVRHGVGAEDALRQVQAHIRMTSKSHRRSPDNDEQSDCVLAWARHDRGATRTPETTPTGCPLSRRDRTRGSLLGLAVGDAVGTSVEFQHGALHQTDMVGGGPFHLEPGQWTDDTSMALCLATSLVECNGFDPHDQMQRYVRWWHEGYLSSNGTCFDIGGTTSASLGRFQETGKVFAGSTAAHSAGNGSLMRLAPVPLFCATHPEQALVYAADSSRTTHGARAAVDACRYMAALLVGALRGETKETLLAPRYTPLAGYWQREPLCAEVDAVAAGSYKLPTAEIEGAGYVVKALEAALWAFYTTEDYREGCLKAVNLGNDADTTAAIYGMLAGAYYGEQGIPQAWRARLAMHALIAGLADQLAEHA
ncbi:MAG: ADP-ribosylglycohydrolase family protein [Anaerolineae bacterium]